MAPAAELAFAFLFGATVGSFLNVVIYRLPRGQSIVHPRSQCPNCEQPIAAWNNIPILSWLILRGRCASCRVSISPRYPMVELLGGALWCAVVARWGLTLAGVAGVILASSCLAIAFIDIDIWEIPDEISLPNILIGAALRPWAFHASWYDGIVGAAAGAFLLYSIRWIYMRFRGVEGMGLGDVKLIAMLGAYLGLEAILPIVLVASISGAVIGGLLLALHRGSKDAEGDAAEGGAQAAAPDAAAPTAVSPAAAAATATEIAAPEPLAATSPEPTEAAPGEAGDEDEDDWVPPPTAVPFGPFLALGGLAELLVGPLMHFLSLRHLGIL